MNSFFKYIRGIVGLEASDGTAIGNDGDTLKIKLHQEKTDGTKTESKVSSLDSQNSTSTPLTANSTFTGTFINCEQYNSISVTILTDQISAVDGALIEFSTDGTEPNILRTIKTTILPSTDGLYFSVPCEGSFYRIKYTNGATDQTTFKLESFLKTETIGQSTLPLTAPLEDTNSVPIQRSIITGRGTNGEYSNQRASDISDLNSTTTPLLANNTYTGQFEDCLGFSNISITLNSDQNSSTDGFVIEWSTDGTNVDNTDEYTIIGGSGKTYSFGVIARYFRIKYTNGATDQTFFRLQTILHITRIKPSTHRIDSAINGENDAELIKAVQTGKNPNNIFVNRRTGGVLDSNSTTTPLTANSTFTGQFFDLSGYGGITVSQFSDVVGCIVFEHSHDGVNVIDTDRFDTTLGEAFFTGIAPIARYVRVKYENGPTDQSTFSLQTIVVTEQLGPSTQPINSELESNSVGITTRSVITGIDNDTGLFNNVGSKDGRLQVEAVSLPQEIRNKTTRFAMDGASKELTVDGSTTPVEFIINADPSADLLVDSMAFTSFASGIKLDKFLSLNSELTNGILIEVKSQDGVFQFEAIKNTLNFDFLFAGGPARSFNLIFASGNDSMVAVYGPPNPIILKQQGTYASDDYIKVIIRDNLSGLNRLRFVADGRLDI